MMDSEIELGEMVETDRERICKLKSLHGESIGDALQEKLIQKVCLEEDHYAVVATTGDQHIGLTHGFISHRLSGAPFLEISSLLIHERFRAKGVGRMRLDKLILSAVNVPTVRARCRIDREIAQRFYSTSGFEKVKTQTVFQRNC